MIMSGGEKYLLPSDVEGRHGTGSRKDGKNMIEVAKELGYTVVYTREEMVKARDADKLLGVFAWGHTFNDRPEETLAEALDPMRMTEPQA